MKKLLFGALVLFVGASLSFGQARLPATVTAGAILKAKSGNLLDECTTGTATSTANAATINADSGTITTESLTTAAAAVYTMTLTNSKITTASKVFASVSSTGTGVPIIAGVTPGSGSAVILVQNNHASAAFNAVLKIRFFVVQ